MLRILKSENGQVLVFTVLWMSLLMGCVAMAVDVGMMFRAKRSVQTAADAAAFAGALDYLYRASTTSAVAVGKAASSSNGYTDGSSGVVVTINTPPVNGPNAGATGYVEAIITEPNPTVFMSRFFGASFTVGARGGGRAAGTEHGLRVHFESDSIPGNGTARIVYRVCAKLRHCGGLERS